MSSDDDAPVSVAWTYADYARALLLVEVQGWLGFTEQGGDNKGQMVEAFQRAVDNRAVGEAWCLAFVWFCIIKAEKLAAAIQHPATSHLHRTEHCMTMWRNSPPGLRVKEPQPGDLVIWNHEGTDAGHVGIITGLRADGDLETVEGNTGPGTAVEREGDGVYAKIRNPSRTGKMVVQGFLRVW